MQNAQYNTQTLHPPTPSTDENSMQLHNTTLNTKTQCKYTILIHNANTQYEHIMQLHSTHYNEQKLHTPSTSPEESVNAQRKYTTLIHNANTQTLIHNANTQY